VPAVDARILWLPFALTKGLLIIRKEKIDLLFASGPSFMNHIIGRLLSRRSGLPLVVDFRDAWSSDPAVKKHSRRRLNRIRKLERKVVKACKRVISTTDGIRLDFIKRYGEMGSKFVAIPNGYNQEDFEKPIHSSFGNGLPLVIVHAGTLGWERSPKAFLKALGELLVEDPTLKGKIKLLLVGQNNVFNDGRSIEDYLEEFKVQPVVELVGFISRKESMQYIQSCHLLLLLIGEVPAEGRFIYGISGKIYDYAASGKPVLTISENGSSATMVDRLRLGKVIAPENAEGIKNEIRAYIKELVTKGKLEAQTDWSLLKQFDFINLTRKLAGCFDGAIRVEKAELEAGKKCRA
jgi:glycosyltransferase involved in cell wall biosynthesis